MIKMKYKKLQKKYPKCSHFSFMAIYSCDCCAVCGDQIVNSMGDLSFYVTYIDKELIIIVKLVIVDYSFFSLKVPICGVCMLFILKTVSSYSARYSNLSELYSSAEHSLAPARKGEGEGS